MYEKVSHKKKWTLELISISRSDAGGLKEVIASIKGTNIYSTLEKDLSTGEIDKKMFAEKSKEYSDVNEIIENARKYLSYEDDKKDLEKILNDSSADKELKNMAEIELSDLKTEFEINEKKLKLFLLPKDEADKKNAII